MVFFDPSLLTQWIQSFAPIFTPQALFTPPPVYQPPPLALPSPGISFEKRDKGEDLVPVHTRHESYTVLPNFPGNFEHTVVRDRSGVMYVCVPAASFGSQLAYNMHRVWLRYFGELFQVTGDHWAFVPCTVGKKKPTSCWRTFTATAKVRFCCSCGNAWTSMHGSCGFQYFLDRRSGAGTVLAQFPGQQCSGCRVECAPLWYEREVFRVIGELRNRVIAKLYPALPVEPLYITRQEGSPRGRHRNDLCVGCRACSRLQSRLSQLDGGSTGDLSPDESTENASISSCTNSHPESM